MILNTLFKTGALAFQINAPVEGRPLPAEDPGISMVLIIGLTVLFWALRPYLLPSGIRLSSRRPKPTAGIYQIL